jgi:electron transport complex protein RnfA
MKDFALMMIGAALVNNVILARFLGLCSFMGVTTRIDTAAGMGLATTFVITVSSMADWAVQHYLLDAFGLGYLRTVTFILVIASAVQFTELTIKKVSPALFQMLGIYLPLITTNCAVLGVPLLNIANGYNFVESLLFGAGSAFGFSLVLVLFAGIRERIEGADVPVYFRGAAIAMVTAGLMALAFMGFAGLDKYQ